jgi:hypothetical protein
MSRSMEDMSEFWSILVWVAPSWFTTKVAQGKCSLLGSGARVTYEEGRFLECFLLR